MTLQFAHGKSQELILGISFMTMFYFCNYIVKLWHVNKKQKINEAQTDYNILKTAKNTWMPEI